MKLLFLSRWCPLPVNNGSKLRIYNLLRVLLEAHQVTLVSFFDPMEELTSAEMEQLGLDDMYLVPYRAYNPMHWKALYGFLSSTPRCIVDTSSAAMEDALAQAVGARHYDLVIASQVWMASYHACFSGIPAIFEEVELGMFRGGHRNAPAPLARLLSRLTWEKHSRFINRLVPSFRACTVVSDVEANLLTAVTPGYKSVRVIPNAVDVEGCETVTLPRDRKSMVFAGSFTYWPNYDAMNWFLTEIYPLIKAKVPSARLTVTGETAGRLLPASPDVLLAGKVPDVHPFVASSTMSIAPMRAGAGTRLKVLEAMALRTPVVATSKAVEGLAVENGKHALIADTPEEYANAVVRIFSEPHFARRLAESAFLLVKNRYDWRVLKPSILELIEEAARA